MDYKNGQIYTIRSKSCPDLVYVGSTCQPLHKRLYAHRRKFNTWQNGHGTYYTSFEILKIGDEHIEWVEDFPTDSKKKLEKREGEIIRSMKCVNRNIPGRTRKEYTEHNLDFWKEYRKKYAQTDKHKAYKREYQKAHKESNASYSKEWREKNKEYISMKQRERVMCPFCQEHVVKVNALRHYQSLKHIENFIWH